MEKVDLEAQEVSNTASIEVVRDDSTDVFKMDVEGNVTLWDREGFIELCEKSEDLTLKAMLAIYNLGIIDGMKL